MVRCHGASERLETCLNLRLDRRLKDKLRAEGRRYIFACHVVSGRTEPARRNDDVRMLPCVEEGSFNLDRLIRDHAAALDGQAEAGELRTEVGEMRVFSNTDEQFISKVDNFDNWRFRHSKLPK